MKKNREPRILLLFPYNDESLKKNFRMVRITLFCFFLGLMQIMATNSYSQQMRITLSQNNQRLEDVLKTIEDQSDFFFIYNKDLIDVNQRVSINVEDKTIREVLDGLFKGTYICYSLVNRQIALSNTQEITTQQQSVGGKVTDSAGMSLPGVSVVVKGTTNGTITGMDGDYSLSKVPTDATLVFSFVGMKTQEISVGGKSQINVTLVEDAVGIEEVVAIGYGTTSKRAVTGSVMKVAGENIVASNTNNIATSLQGKAAGVQITRNSGDPNAGVNIRIRGTSSINSGGNPLVVVDGIPGGISLNDLNPNDIESIEILKDASAGAIFGSRAANGVVLVTTKKGSKEKSSINFEVQRGVSTAVDSYEIANSSQLLQIYDIANWNRDPAKKASKAQTVFPEYGWDGFDRSVAATTNTDWSKIVQNDKAHYNLISVQSMGGTEKTKVFLSGYYRNYNSLNAGSSFDKAQLRINIEHQLKKWITVGANVTESYSSGKDAWGSYNLAYTRLLPIYPVYSPARSGKYFYDRVKSGEAGISPYYKRDETWSDDQSMRSLTIGYLELKPIQGLTVRSEWSLNFSNSRSRAYQSKDYRRDVDSYAYQMSTSTPKVGVSGGINYGRYQSYNWTTNNYVTFDKNIKDHRINVVVGQTAEGYTYDGNSNQYEGFPSEYFTLTNANTELVATRQSASYDQYRFLSYFGRAKYSYKDRYHAEVSYRADGSSRFGVKDRWGYFPGASLGWVMSEENFMKNISEIDYMKLRLSRGFVGNAEMESNYPYLSTLVAWGPYGGSPGFLFNNIGNDEIHWESQVQTNVGLDFTVLNNRISGTFDYFVKDARDLIVSNKIGTFHGYFNTGINVNLGTLRNSGFDLSITTHNLVGTLKWDTEFNISRAHSVVKTLSPTQRYIDSGKNRVVEGFPLGAYYIPVWAGVDQATGHELVYGVNQGSESTQVATTSDLTGEVIDAERLNATQYNNQRVLFKDKTPYPDLYGGLTNTLKYKGFELSCLFVFQYGNWIYDEGIQSLNYVSTSFDRNVSPDLLNGWTSEKPTNIPLLWNTQMSGRASSRFLYDGSYVRLKNLTLAYQFPKSILDRLKLSNVRVFIMGENLLTFTKYPGADPEFFNTSGSAANISPGLAGISMPQVRTITFGINLGL